MSIWNKVLLCLLFVCSGLLFYCSLQSLNSRTAWQKSINQLKNDIVKMESENRLLEYGIDTNNESSPNAKTLPSFGEGALVADEYEKAIQTLVYGDEPKESLVHLRNDVDLLIRDRDARTWFECSPNDVAVNGTDVVVGAVPTANLPTIMPKTLVYLFDTRPMANGGSFLGAFYFEEVAQNQAVLKNSYLMTETEVARLNTSKGANAPWIAYTKLPGDNHGYFVDGRRSLPVVAEEGETLNPPVMEEKSSGNDANLAPHASTTAFLLLIAERIKQQQHVDTLNIRLAKINQAIEQANEHKDYYEKVVITRTGEELKEMNQQRDEVLNLKNSLAAAITNLEKEIESIKTANKAMIARMTEAQLAAAEMIHERNAMAVAGQ